MKIQSVMIHTIVINLNLESLVGKCKIEISNLVSEQNLQHVYLLLISAVFFIFVSEKKQKVGRPKTGVSPFPHPKTS